MTAKTMDISSLHTAAQLTMSFGRRMADGRACGMPVSDCYRLVIGQRQEDIWRDILSGCAGEQEVGGRNLRL